MEPSNVGVLAVGRMRDGIGIIGPGEEGHDRLVLRSRRPVRDWELILERDDEARLLERLTPSARVVGLARFEVTLGHAPHVPLGPWAYKEHHGTRGPTPVHEAPA